MDDYIRRAYYVFCGTDIRRLPQGNQEAFALLPPDPDWHDFGDFTTEEFDGIRERHIEFGLDYGHDFATDCDANRRIDAALAKADYAASAPRRLATAGRWAVVFQSGIGGYGLIESEQAAWTLVDKEQIPREEVLVLPLVNPAEI